MNKKKTITKTETVVKEITVYESSDGMQFENEAEFWNHEKSILENRVEHIRVDELEGCIPCNDEEHMEEYNHTWYKPMCHKDIEDINELYCECLVDDKDIGRFVCVESYDDWYWSGNAWATYEDDILNDVKCA